MKQLYFLIGAVFLGAAGAFGSLAMILLDADGMTREEYAWQARRLVCEQTVGDRCPAAQERLAGGPQFK